jgi:hypothetical protein
MRRAMIISCCAAIAGAFNAPPCAPASSGVRSLRTGLALRMSGATLVAHDTAAFEAALTVPRSRVWDCPFPGPAGPPSRPSAPLFSSNSVCNVYSGDDTTVGPFLWAGDSQVAQREKRAWHSAPPRESRQPRFSVSQLRLCQTFTSSGYTVCVMRAPGRYAAPAHRTHAS